MQPEMQNRHITWSWLMGKEGGVVYNAFPYLSSPSLYFPLPLPPFSSSLSPTLPSLCYSHSPFSIFLPLPSNFFSHSSPFSPPTLPSQSFSLSLSPSPVTLDSLTCTHQPDTRVSVSRLVLPTLSSY